MTQSDLYRAVARATGESVSVIRNLGFVPLAAIPIEREPLTVNWDELVADRPGLFPIRSQRRTSVA